MHISRKSDEGMEIFGKAAFLAFILFAAVLSVIGMGYSIEKCSTYIEGSSGVVKTPDGNNLCVVNRIAKDEKHMKVLAVISLNEQEEEDREKPAEAVLKYEIVDAERLKTQIGNDTGENNCAINNPILGLSVTKPELARLTCMISPKQYNDIHSNIIPQNARYEEHEIEEYSAEIRAIIDMVPKNHVSRMLKLRGERFWLRKRYLSILQNMLLALCNESISKPEGEIACMGGLLMLFDVQRIEPINSINMVMDKYRMLLRDFKHGKLSLEEMQVAAVSMRIEYELVYDLLSEFDHLHDWFSMVFHNEQHRMAGLVPATPGKVRTKNLHSTRGDKTLTTYMQEIHIHKCMKINELQDTPSSDEFEEFVTKPLISDFLRKNTLSKDEVFDELKAALISPVESIIVDLKMFSKIKKHIKKEIGTQESTLHFASMEEARGKMSSIWHSQILANYFKDEIRKSEIYYSEYTRLAEKYFKAKIRVKRKTKKEDQAITSEESVSSGAERHHKVSGISLNEINKLFQSINMFLIGVWGLNRILGG
ncbi:uncharacterized protein NEMAJ01_1637 [Nematocida major]|uniref:uncharacterized protein n=1 Tax=Nematocida major TaxID=1912982 RepID=UPI002008C1D8|nr:uncharacterized protein NEMAJ01_1637 [Nematocida major]KAH9386741.1 hypothetical protein NEMAJ01_1637 [Nematocida major]